MTLPVPYVPEKAEKIRTILVVYRGKVSVTPFDVSRDRWMFLSLKSAHYGLCGYTLDLVMLMDGITQEEVLSNPDFVNIFIALKPDGVILEAG